MENENNIVEQSIENRPVQDAGGLQPKKKKKILINMLILLGSILAVYLGFSIFFMSHYYFDTVISGVNYGGQNKEQVTKQILGPKTDYTVKLLGRDSTEAVIATTELDMEYVFDDTIYQINDSQNGFGWIAAIFQNKQYELPVYAAYDKEKLQTQLSRLPMFDKSGNAAPKDAYISAYQPQTGDFEIVAEEQGNTLDMDKTLAAVDDAFMQMVLSQKEITVDLEQADCYQKPTVLADDADLQKELKQANTYVSANITYDWNGQEEIVDGALISEWIVFNAKSVKLDEEAIEAYIKALAKKNDTYGKNRDFTTTAGNVLELKSGAYGWKTDVKAETEAVIEEIRKGEILKKEPLYQSRGYVKGEDDIGDSYVEINLSAQHLYVYQSGAIVFESDFVSGNMSNGNVTPAGVFGLTYRTRNAVLRGENYETPVNYWMPFNGNIGMHDATWRNAFGGDIYLTGGSHGCINLPLASAEVIYGYVKTGFPVVCYY